MSPGSGVEPDPWREPDVQQLDVAVPWMDQDARWPDLAVRQTSAMQFVKDGGEADRDVEE